MTDRTVWVAQGEKRSQIDIAQLDSWLADGWELVEDLHTSDQIGDTLAALTAERAYDPNSGVSPVPVRLVEADPEPFTVEAGPLAAQDANPSPAAPFEPEQPEDDASQDADVVPEPEEQQPAGDEANQTPDGSGTPAGEVPGAEEQS